MNRSVPLCLVFLCLLIAPGCVRKPVEVEKEAKPQPPALVPVEKPPVPLTPQGREVDQATPQKKEKPPEPKKEEPVKEVGAAGLAVIYYRNEAAGDLEYTGKRIRAIAYPNAVEKAGQHYFVVVGWTQPFDSSKVVKFRFSDPKEVATIKPNSQTGYIIEGKVKDWSSGILLIEDCKFIGVKKN